MYIGLSVLVMYGPDYCNTPHSLPQQRQQRQICQHLGDISYLIARVMAAAERWRHPDTWTLVLAASGLPIPASSAASPRWSLTSNGLIRTPRRANMEYLLRNRGQTSIYLPAQIKHESSLRSCDVKSNIVIFCVTLVTCRTWCHPVVGRHNYSKCCHFVVA